MKIFSITYASCVNGFLYCETKIKTTIEDVNDVLDDIRCEVNSNKLLQYIDRNYVYNGGSKDLIASDVFSGDEYQIKLRENEIP